MLSVLRGGCMDAHSRLCHVQNKSFFAVVFAARKVRAMFGMLHFRTIRATLFAVAVTKECNIFETERKVVFTESRMMQESVALGKTKVIFVSAF